MYIISDDQWARESNGHIKVLRTRVIDVSYGLLKAWFNCPPVAPPPPVSLDGPTLDHHGHPQNQQQAPPIPLFRDFIHNAVHRTRTPLNAMVAAVYLVRRLRDRNPNCAGTSITPHRVMLAAIMLACKLLYDDTYSNRTWVHVSQGIFSLEEINRMEWEFLSYIKFEAAIAREDWINHVQQMDSHLAEESRDMGMMPLQQELNLVAMDEDTRAMSPDEIAFIGQMSVQQLQHLHQHPAQPATQPTVLQCQSQGQQPSELRMAGGSASVSSASSAEDVTSLPTAAEHGSSAASGLNHHNTSGSTRVTRSLSRKKSQNALAAASTASLAHGSSSASAPSRQSTSSYPHQSHSAKVMPSMPTVAVSDPVPRPNSAAAALAAHRSSSASTSSLPSTASSGSSAPSWHQGSHSHASLPSAPVHHPHANPHSSVYHQHQGLASAVPSQPPIGQQQFVHSAPFPVSQSHQPILPPPAFLNTVPSNNNSSSSRTPMPAQSSSGTHHLYHHLHQQQHHGSAVSSGQQQHYNIPRPYSVAHIPPHHVTSLPSQSNGSGSGSVPQHQAQQGAWYPPPAWPAHSFPQQQPVHASQSAQHMPPPANVPAGHHHHQHGSGGMQTYSHPHPPAQMQPAHLIAPPPPLTASCNTGAGTRDVLPALVRARTGSNPATVGMPSGAPVLQQQQQQQTVMLAAAAAAAPLNKRGDSGTDLHALQQLHGLAGAAAAASATQHAQYGHHHRGQAVSGALGGGRMGVTVNSGNAHGAACGKVGSKGFGQ